MTSLAISENSIVVVKNLHVEHYESCNHNIVEISEFVKLQGNDSITDVIVSSDGQLLALITSISKQLLIFELPLAEKCKSFTLPRSASKIRFTADNQQILVADKSGDVLIYNLKNEVSGTKLLGHLSLLLDVLQTPDGKFIITSDRDEKIKVSCYPNTYNIQTYCLGHKEFVNHIELLPHNEKFLTSTSGDGHLKVWNYTDGKLLYTIDTNVDVDEEHSKTEFSKIMDVEGVEVNTLPIVHYTALKLDQNSSLLALVVHNFNKLLLYKLETADDVFSHKLITRIDLERCPSAIKFYNNLLYLYDNVSSDVTIYNVKDETLELSNKVKMFENVSFSQPKEINDNIKVLYKRRFDNVQEYQERKRQRLEKANNK